MDEGLCTIKNSLLNGKGMFANNVIPQGTLILSEDAKYFIKLSENCVNFTKNDEIFGNCDHCVSFHNLFYELECEACDGTMKFCSEQCKKSFQKTHTLICPKNLVSITAELKLAFIIAIDSHHRPETQPPLEPETNTERLLTKIGETRENYAALSEKLKNLGQKTPLSDFLQFVYKFSFVSAPPIFDEFPVALCVYEKASFFNHSCNPNVHVWFESKTINFNALTDIAPGEELVLSYVQNTFFVGVEQRAGFILEKFGFFCECEMCVGGGVNLESCAVDEEKEETLSKLYESGEQHFENGDFATAWDHYSNYFSFLTKTQNNSLALNNLWSIDKILNLAILLNKSAEGLDLARFVRNALKTKNLEKNGENPKNRLSSPAKKKTQNQKNKKMTLSQLVDEEKKPKGKKQNNKVLGVNASDGYFQCETSETALIEFKCEFLETAFMVNAIETEMDYFEKEPVLFEKAVKIRNLGRKLFGEKFESGVLKQMDKTVHSLAAVCKIIESVDGYYRE